MQNDFSQIPASTRYYDILQIAVQDVAAYQRGEYSLFTPLPESVLQAERQKRQSGKEVKQSAPRKPEAPVDRLTAAARALSKKKEALLPEDGDGQISFDFTDTKSESGPEPELKLESTLESELTPEPEQAAEPHILTVREILEQFSPVLKDLVMKDTAYQNACQNSDQENAYLEGNEAVKRAVLTVDDELFRKLYFDNPTFHRRLHRDVVSETYLILSQQKPEQEQTAEFAEETDSVPSDEKPITEPQAVSDSEIVTPAELSTEQKIPEPVPTVEPVMLYRNALEMLDKTVKSSNLRDYFQESGTDYDMAMDTLDTEIAYYMEEIAADYPDIAEAYLGLPMFREWLVEDLLERNYQDVLTDSRIAPERYANDSDAPDWAKQPADITVQDNALPEPPEEAVMETENSSESSIAEPNLTPNVSEYLNLKTQYSDKLVGVQVDDTILFYGKDAEEAAPALGTKLMTREIPDLGETAVTGSSQAWQATLKRLLEHGKSVVLARPDAERGPDAPYEIIKERDAAEYIPTGMELKIDGRRMKVDSVDFQSGKVSLLDMDLKDWFPVFREEPISFVRKFVEEVLLQEFDIAALPEAAEPIVSPEPAEIDGGKIVESRSQQRQRQQIGRAHV